MAHRKVVALLAAATCVIGAVGCGSSSDGDSERGGGGSSSKATIALVVGNANDAFYQKVIEGAKGEAERLGVELLAQGPTRFAVPEQVAVVDALLAKNPDALAISPVDPTALTAPLRKWADADKPIVTFDSTVADPPFELASQISSQNVEGGAMAADEMARLLGDRGKVAIIDLNTANKVLTDRKDGFEAQLKAKHPGVEVIDTQLTGDDFARATTIAQTLITKNPDLDGIFCTFEFAATFAAKAIADADAQERVTLIGYEAGPKQIDYIRKGVIKAAVAQQPAEEGKLAVQMANAAATGDTAALRPVIRLPNVLITQENVDSMVRYHYEAPR